MWVFKACNHIQKGSGLLEFGCKVLFRFDKPLPTIYFLYWLFSVMSIVEERGIVCCEVVNVIHAPKLRQQNKLYWCLPCSGVSWGQCFGWRCKEWRWSEKTHGCVRVVFCSRGLFVCLWQVWKVQGHRCFCIKKDNSQYLIDNKAKK